MVILLYLCNCECCLCKKKNDTVDYNGVVAFDMLFLRS